jgi:PmbA protein
VATALASRNAAISAPLKPTSRMISTVCSPTIGDFRRVSTGASESLIGLAADFTGPPYKEKQGESIASPLFSLLNRPRASNFPEGADFDGFGIPTADTDIVRDGKLDNFLIDFYIARKLTMPQTAGAWNFVVPPGNRSLDDIVASTRRGIILSRFSGGNPNSNLDFSGVVKNSFYVENGEIRHALTETMVSGSLQDLFRNIHAVSREHINFGDHDYPYIAASGVTISAK